MKETERNITINESPKAKQVSPSRPDFPESPKQEKMVRNKSKESVTL